MSEVTIQIRITAIRSRGSFGGVIFSGISNDEKSYVALCDFKLLPDPSQVQKGQVWGVTGALSTRESKMANGFKVIEQQIVAVSVQLIRPSGRNIIYWIAESPDCSGIGQVKAAKLYEYFGTKLGELIERRDFCALTEVITEKAAHLLCHAFEKYKVVKRLLESHSVI